MNGFRPFLLDIGITLVILQAMKTTVSLPGPLFEAAEQLAQQLNLPRSELYARAIASYLETCQKKSITEQLNEIYAEEKSSVDPIVYQKALLSLPQEDW